MLVTLQESAIYCVGLYRGLLKLFGQAVMVNFANNVSKRAHLTCGDMHVHDAHVHMVPTYMIPASWVQYRPAGEGCM